jgi:hypothetical protein
MHVLVALIFTCFTCFTSNKKKAYKELAADDKLIGRSNCSLHKGGLSRTGSVSSTIHIPVPMAMNNNIALASSYGKANHWQRMEEANMGLLAEIRDDNYGAIEHDIHRETIA